ncbi:MAG: hypothetical protein U0871_18175 [Gemmataceae bacterium]
MTTSGTGRPWVRPTAFGGVAVGVIAVGLFAFRSPPQMGVDEDAFRAVDALYTAVRMRDAAKVADCERRLQAHRTDGKLPADAADHLDRLIARAKGGDWESATEQLYTFMLAQRRDGPLEPKAKPSQTKTRPTRR